MALLLSLLPATHPASAEQKDGVAGRVVYLKKKCHADTSTDTFEGLAGARLRLRREGTEPVVTTLGGDGRFEAEIGGTGPISATAILKGRLVSVRPDMNKAPPYKIYLGELRPNVSDEVRIKHPVRSGAANIWNVINAGADFAAEAWDTPLPPIPVLWRFDQEYSRIVGSAVGTSHHDSTDPKKMLIRVDGDGKNRRDEWEPWPLLHEYAHHVLLSIASPSGKPGSRGQYWTNPGESHGPKSVHADRPALPFLEGFADAFAASVLGTPQLTTECGAGDGKTDLAAGPGKIDKPRLTQYNEGHVGKLFLSLVGYLGKGDVATGWRELLLALHKYKFEEHHPQEMRELRDALIHAGLEKNNPNDASGSYDLHNEITALFTSADIGWGVSVQTLDIDKRENTSIDYELVPTISGPGVYGDCRVKPGQEHIRMWWPGTSQKRQGTPADSEYYGKDEGDGYGPDYGDYWPGSMHYGALDYTWHDDCLIAGYSESDVEGSNLPFPARLEMRLPYLPENAHRDTGGYTLEIEWRCISHEERPCTDHRLMELKIKIGAQPPLRTADGKLLTMKMTPSNEVLTFDATGKCTFVPDPRVDCSV